MLAEKILWKIRRAIALVMRLERGIPVRRVGAFSDLAAYARNGDLFLTGLHTDSTAGLFWGTADEARKTLGERLCEAAARAIARGEQIDPGEPVEPLPSDEVWSFSAPVPLAGCGGVALVRDGVGLYEIAFWHS